MPPKKKTRVDKQKIDDAVNEVLRKDISVRSVATLFNVSKSHLHRLVTKAKTSECTTFVYEPNIGNKRVFTVDQECSLADYLKTSAKMCYGLTTKQVRELAYQYAQSSVIDQESNKNKSNGKTKKNTENKKNVQATQKKKKAARKIASSSSSNDTLSNVDTYTYTIR